jgi:glutamate racemase
MQAHHNGETCPPQINIDLFARYAEDLVQLWNIDALILTCSTMNRSAGAVREVMAKYDVPVVQIDEPMMEAAVAHGGKILVVATHGPTVDSTTALLRETADRNGSEAAFAGATVEEAFELLGAGDIQKHNEVIADAIRSACGKETIDIAVLAQLSMSVFKLSYPNCEKEFGIPVLTSGECGFARAGEILKGI